MQNEIKVNKPRFLEIDSLRGIAAIIVLISHYTWAYDFHYHILAQHPFHFPYGDMGVQIFFIISGFVIFMTLKRVKTIKEFIISRFSRLYPTYWLCIIITVVATMLFPIPTLGHYTLKEILLNITMVAGLFKIRYIDQVYWSLEVELFFYIILGLIFYIKKLQYIDYIVIVWLFVCVLSLCFEFPLEKYVKKIFILHNAPLFITGILMYKIKLKTATLLNHLTIPAAFIIYCFNFHEDYPTDFRPYILVLCIFIMFYVYAFWGLSFLKHRIFLFFGTISYPLYLLHNVIGYAILYRVRAFVINQFFYCIITASIAIALAWLVTKYFDSRATKWTKIKLTLLLNKRSATGNEGVLQ
jgi:peptidoglycan/LPS O-acetylase OafA/YrhL